MNMQGHNLYRLIEASPFSDHLSDGATDALVEYLSEIEVTLKSINIDDQIINGFYFFNDRKEAEESGIEIHMENILYEDNDEIVLFA